MINSLGFKMNLQFILKQFKDLDHKDAEHLPIIFHQDQNQELDTQTSDNFLRAI